MGDLGTHYYTLLNNPPRLVTLGTFNQSEEETGRDQKIPTYSPTTGIWGKFINNPVNKK